MNKTLSIVAVTTVFILLVPLLAMHFTTEVDWNLADFVVAGALLFGTGLIYVLLSKKVSNIAYRAAIGVMLAAAFLLIWINLAVGIIGNESNPANLMYIGVLAVLFIGAIIARFQPHGMSIAMFVTALAQALVTMIALIARLGYPGSGPLEILTLNGFFVALFVGSAWLFRPVAQK